MTLARRRGFTLVELLVVVAILAGLAAMGIIQILRARIVTYEQLAITSVRGVGKACQLFYLTNAGQYPADLATLGAPLSNPPYLDAALAAGTKQGYVFAYTQGAGGTTFTLLANPQIPGTTGTRYFYLDQDQVIHVNASGPADGGDPVLP